MHPKQRACTQNYARASQTTRVHPKLCTCIQNYARASKTSRASKITRMHPKLRTCIQNFARASKTTCVHPKLRACIQDYDRLTASQRISYHHFVFYIYVFLIIVNPLVRLGDGSDCYAVIFFQFLSSPCPPK